MTGYIPLARNGLKLGRPEWMVEKAKVLLDEHQRVMSLLKKYPEIVIGAGTDSTGEMSDEIIELVSAMGCQPIEGLKIATLGSAKVLDIQERTGTLEVDKIADMIVADGNLTENLLGLKNLKLVVKSGIKVQ